MIARQINEAAWKEWVATRPQSIQRLCEQFPPDRLYRLKSTGHRGLVESYNEDGTLSVSITGEYNRTLFSRKVFGIQPEDLEECDLPAEGEDLGDTAAEAGYTEKDIREILIPKLKELKEAP